MHLVLPPSVPPSKLHVDIRHPSGSLAALRRTYALEQHNSLLALLSSSKNQPSMSQAKRAGASHVPAAFLCPLSKEVMSEPVTLVESGVTYQCEEIVAWFAE